MRFKWSDHACNQQHLRWNEILVPNERYRFKDPDPCFASDSSLMPDIKWCQPFKQLESQRKHPRRQHACPSFSWGWVWGRHPTEESSANFLGKCHVTFKPVWETISDPISSFHAVDPPKKQSHVATGCCSSSVSSTFANQKLLSSWWLSNSTQGVHLKSPAPHLDLLCQHVDAQVRICTAAARGNQYHLRLGSGAVTKPSMRGIRPTTSKLACFKCVVANTCCKWIRLPCVVKIPMRQISRYSST